MSLENSLERIKDLMNLNESDSQFKRRVSIEVIDEYFQMYLDQAMTNLPKFEDLSDWQIKGLIDTIIWNTVFSIMHSYNGITEYIDMFSLFEKLKSFYRTRIMDSFRSERNNDDEQPGENFLNENNTSFLKRRIDFDYVEELVDTMIEMLGQIPDGMSFDDFCFRVLWDVSGSLEMRHEIDLNYTQLHELVDMLKKRFHEKLFITYFQQKDNSLNTNIQENISRISQLMGISENTYIKRRIESDKIEKVFSFYLDYLLNDLNHYEWEGYPDLPIKDMEKFINRVISFVTLAIWNDFDEYFHNHPEEKEGISTMIRNSFEDRIRDSFIEKITSNYKKNTEFNSNL